MEEEKPDPPLPRLRQDLQLNVAPAEEGAPTWTIYDPGANKYYKIGWMEFECLTRFSRCKTVSQIVELVQAETTLEPGGDDIVMLINFLFRHHLVQSEAEAFVNYLSDEKTKAHQTWWQKIFHSYLYFTIPLFKPQKVLKAIYPYISFMFTKQFFGGVLLLLGYGIYLSLARVDEIGRTFMSYLSLEGAFYLLITTFIVKFVHEMGHAFMATKYNVPVTTLGIAVMVLYPVLYAETTNAWKMQDRRKRIHISMAGVMAETTLASVALLFWHMLPPGMGQSICFMISVVSLTASILVNTNPLMRFDGYYLMSDLVGIDNLQERSFAFAKWKLRAWLFGWDAGPPEQLAEERRNFLILFGFATMIYRFFLFTGIAFLVYFMFFKPLGLVLFLVEIIFFVLWPIVRELMVWMRNARLIASSARGKFLFFLLLAGCAMTLIPAERSVEVPAVLHAGKYTRIYPPAAVQVTEIAVRTGTRVTAGQILFRLASPSLEHDIVLAQLKLDTLVEIKNRQQANPELVRDHPTLDAEIEGAHHELEGLETQKKKLEVTAPFDGIIRDMYPDLNEGSWISVSQMMCVVVGPESLTLSGYVGEQDLPRIHKEAHGWFYADFSPLAKFPVALKKVEDTDSPDIYWPELSSPFGGPIPADRNPGSRQIHPQEGRPIYAAQFSLLPGEENAGLPTFVAPGIVVLDADPVSLVSLTWERFLALIMRESGF